MNWSSRLVSRMLALVLLAAALGLTFNRTNPLGLSWQPVPARAVPTTPMHAAGKSPVLSPMVNTEKTTPALASVPPAQPKATVKPAPVARTPVKPAPAHYQNESLPVTPPVITAGSPYQNQTLPICAAVQPEAGGPPAVTWAETRQWMAEHGAMLVDARPPSAFQAGAIPGAVSLPYANLAEVMPAFGQDHNTETWIVVYCSDDDCGLSLRCALALMKDYGYRHVAYLAGGFTEWQRQQVLPANDAPTGAP